MPIDGTHMSLRVAWELYLMVGIGKMLILGHIVSSVPKNHGVFRPLSLDTLIDGGQRQVDHARAFVPCPIKGGVEVQPMGLCKAGASCSLSQA